MLVFVHGGILMGTLLLVQMLVDLILIGVIAYMFMERSRASRREDPRLSRGLQLLQNKIAVFQDLMDRAETFSGQMTQLMDRKAREIQEKIEDAAIHIHKVSDSISRSTEVAKIFQDRIPHAEIIERQNTLKYVQAAKLAHSGASVDEIQKKTDLPRGEVELIAKLNRDQLMISQVPEWVEEYEKVQTPEATSQFVESRFEAKQEPAAGPAQSSNVSAAIRAAAEAVQTVAVTVQNNELLAATTTTRRAVQTANVAATNMGVSAVVANTGTRTTVYPVTFKKLDLGNQK